MDSLPSYPNSYYSSRGPAKFLHHSSTSYRSANSVTATPGYISHHSDMMPDQYVQFHPEGRSFSASVSHPSTTSQPPHYTASLPRRTQSLRRHADYYSSLPFQRPQLQVFKNQFPNQKTDRFRTSDEVLQVERSRSVPPHLWNAHPYSGGSFSETLISSGLTGKTA